VLCRGGTLHPDEDGQVIDWLVVECAPVEIFAALNLVVVDVESNGHGVCSRVLDVEINWLMKAGLVKSLLLLILKQLLYWIRKCE
jgi:hypothetical protein